MQRHNAIHSATHSAFFFRNILQNLKIVAWHSADQKWSNKHTLDGFYRHAFLSKFNAELK